MKILAFHPASLGWLSRLPQDFPDAEWTLASSLSDVARALPGAEIFILPNSGCTPELGGILRKADALRWIHFTTAGIDRGLAMGLPDNMLASASEIVVRLRMTYPPSMCSAEWAVVLITMA